MTNVNVLDIGTCELVAGPFTCPSGIRWGVAKSKADRRMVVELSGMPAIPVDVWDELVQRMTDAIDQLVLDDVPAVDDLDSCD